MYNEVCKKEADQQTCIKTERNMQTHKVINMKPSK